MIYTHGYMVFKNEKEARKYAERNIQRSREFWTKSGKECSEIVEKIKRKGNKETHVFSFTFPMEYNYNKVSVVTRSYVAQEIL